MPSTVFDSGIFRDAFGSPAMRVVFDDESVVAKYVEVEVALAAAEGIARARADAFAAALHDVDAERLGEADGAQRSAAPFVGQWASCQD